MVQDGALIVVSNLEGYKRGRVAVSVGLPELLGV